MATPALSLPLCTPSCSCIEKIPRALEEKFAAITALTDTFCEKYLNDEYRVLIHRVVGSFARKRPSPLLRGKENVWTTAAVHAVGRINFNGLVIDIRQASRPPRILERRALSSGDSKFSQSAPPWDASTCSWVVRRRWYWNALKQHSRSAATCLPPASSQWAAATA